eukprot:TRINITY_DN6205_c0_g1_i2.p1 TRINITY_DN6205_c0_g1~~TRINITY_DN6205_c0_g1_i2.p1  ORF type:complete len:290 (-),score=96.72 TRINITY_DN6205_c0_g1_i2:105-926(-)
MCIRDRWYQRRVAFEFRMEEKVNKFESLLGNAQANKAAIETLVTELKVDFVKSGLQSQAGSVDLYRRFNELLVFAALEANNIDEFLNALSRLKGIYAASTTQSQHYYLVTALELLYNLSNNRMTEFHSALELLRPDDLSNNLIDYVVKLERAFQIGSYGDVLRARDNLPSPYFKPFMARINSAIAFEISRSLERAYQSLDLADAKKIYKVQNDDDLQAIIRDGQASAEENGYQWTLQGNQLSFRPLEQDRKGYDSKAVIGKMLEYTQELEKIV